MALVSSVVTVEWSPASTPFATSPTWVDITSDVRAVSISRGRSGSFDLYGAGKANITLDNRAGTFDPTAWHRWRQVRITATATGPTSNVIFRGFVQTIRHDQSLAPRDAVAVIECIDLMGLVSRYELDTVAANRSTEKSGVRVAAVLAEADIPSAWYSTATGIVDVVAPGGPVVNSLQHIQDVTEAEGGAFYTSAAGVLTFEDRYEGIDRLSSAAVTVFSDTPAGADVPFLYGDLLLTPPGLEYRNRVLVTGADGVAVEWSDIPTDYPRDTLSRNLPIATSSESDALAEMLLEVYKQTTVIWPEGVSVSVWPDSQNTLDEITALDLREYCQVEFTPAGKTQQTYKVFVESISHSIGPSHWTARIGFSSADRWEDAWGVKTDYLILDDATFGLLDTGKLGY